MKLGFNMLLWTTYVTEEHLPLLETLKNVGYDGVEIPLFEGDTKHFEKVGKAIKDNGLGCTTVTVIPDEEHNPVSADSNNRQAAVDYLKWAIDCSAALGSPLLCGPFYQPLGVFTGQGPTQKEKQRAVEVNRHAAEVDAAVNVPLGVEFLNRFKYYFLNPMTNSADCVNRTKYPNTGVVYDTFDVNIEEQGPAEGQPPNRKKTGFDPLYWKKRPENIFIIGHDEGLLLEAQKILANDFALNPIILQEQPDGGSPTTIGKFNSYARMCSYVLAILTPDERVERNNKLYSVPKPNVIFELGWFCAHLGRKKILVLQQDGTDLTAFSDFAGVLCKRFKKHIAEIVEQLRREFTLAGLIRRPRNTLN